MSQSLFIKFYVNGGSIIFYQKLIATPLGALRAVADSNNLSSLKFINGQKDMGHSDPTNDMTQCVVLAQLESELENYFKGVLKQFQTPYRLQGTDFQKSVWQALVKIPYGETVSYQQQAESIGKSKAFRAVANANGRNQLVIIIPCHRVIQKNGALGGYAAGVDRKQALLDLERGVFTGTRSGRAQA